MPRGSAPGERRGGRKPGVPNKVGADVREAAAQYSSEALTTLAEIMRSPEHPAAARVSAAEKILDRAHGKAPQAVKLGGDEEAGPIQQVIRWAMTDSEALPDPSR